MPELQTFLADIEEQAAYLGGYYNAHIHLDRAGTLNCLSKPSDEGSAKSALSLTQKHGLIPAIHRSGAYETEALKTRARFFIEQMISSGTTRVDTVVDVDGDHLRLSALETMASIKEEFAGQLELQIGSYCPFGFRSGQCSNWENVRQGAIFADFIGLLPERDDTALYPDHIGYRESCRKGLMLSEETSKPIHIHVDQANHASDHGSETVVDVMEELELNHSNLEEPRVWLVHVISPTVYDEDRFMTLRDKLAYRNVGIVTCPSAAISMRQYRSVMSPTDNCIARVLELVAAGVSVRIGTDNICDITSPLGTTDMAMELFVLANAIRYYDAEFLAKMAAGISLNDCDLQRVKDHLLENEDRVKEFLHRIQ